MNTKADSTGAQANWFVGASYGGTDDQMPRFLAEGIWENGDDDKLLDVVRSMRPGERIAIKSSYTRKHGLPFDSRGRAVSVMGIKAVGTITENLNDGKRVKVDWAKVEPVREWYFYTHRATIWRVLPGEWMNDALIAFAFDGKPLAHSYNASGMADSQTGRAQSWFARAPAPMPVTEMTRVAGQYDYTLTLLLLPEAEWQGARHDEEEPEDDTYDRFVRNGQYPVR